MTQSQRLVVESWTDNLGPKIHEGQIGAQSSVDGYYSVMFTGEPFQANETTVLEGYEPPIEVEAVRCLLKSSIGMMCQELRDGSPHQVRP
jgi:hypothetical protein